MKTRILALLALALLGCGRASEAGNDVDAGVHVTIPASSSSWALVERTPAFADAIARAVDLELRDGALRPVADARTSVAAALPATKRAVLHLEDPRDPGFWIDVDAGEGEAVETNGKGVVIRAIAPDTDAVYVAGPAGAEELRTLLSEAAPTTWRWRVARSPSVAALRVRDGRIEALDADGVLRLSSEAPFAVDAKGVRRAVSVSIDERDPSAIVAALDVRDLAFPIVVDPAWVASGVLVHKAVWMEAARLPDGRVLAVFGSNSQLYDPKTGAWTDGPKLAGDYGAEVPGTGSRPGIAAVTGGKILVTFATAELFDPATSKWASAGKAGATMTGLRTLALAFAGGAKVLAVCGSQASTASDTAQIYDVASNAWASTASMAVARAACGGTVLKDGRVLVVGGKTTGGASLASAEIFDPSTSKWTTVASMSVARSRPHVALLPDGRVFVGGDADANSKSSEIYDPATNEWTSVPATTHAHQDATATVVAGGKVLVVGGFQVSAAELFDPATKTWSSAGSMVTPRGGHFAVPLQNGRVLVGGGAGHYAGISGFTHVGASELFGDELGASCSLGYECASGFCVEGVCCATASCPAGASCATASKKGTCVFPLGAKCTSSAQCESGRCVDGVCCNAACDGQCEACDLPEHLGVCWPVLGAPRGGRPACTGPGAGTACGDRCDGVDRKACHVPGPAAACSADTCVSGIETHASTCDASGACGDVPKSCGAYACGATTCKTSCSSKADCAAGYFCKDSACVPHEGLGTACTTAATCATGFCTDGVCCGVADCGLGSSCATEKKGICAKTLGTECGSDLECGSGHCVDGVCCDAACDGQCEACDVPGRLGKCSPVSGEPHGQRAKCDDGGGDPCKARTCEGTIDPTSCAGYANGPTVACGAASCTGATFVGEGRCDGKGVCVAPAPRECAPYACDRAGCRAACARNEHCAEGFVCLDGTCKPLVATCSEDKLQSIAKDGTTTSCVPFRCGPNGACIEQCATSSDCAPGATCDPSSRLCVMPSVSTDDGGGCAVFAAPGGSGGAIAGIVVLAAGLGLARRRRSLGG